MPLKRYRPGTLGEMILDPKGPYVRFDDLMANAAKTAKRKRDLAHLKLLTELLNGPGSVSELGLVLDCCKSSVSRRLKELRTLGAVELYNSENRVQSITAYGKKYQIQLTQQYGEQK